MDNLTKVATVCAKKYLEKKATTARQLVDEINAGNIAALKSEKLIKALRGPQSSSLPTWAKLLLGAGGGKVVLDNVNKDQPTGWRR